MIVALLLVSINAELGYPRLKEYWMSDEEMSTFEVHALNFARGAVDLDPSRQVIPILVTMEGEAIE